MPRCLILISSLLFLAGSLAGCAEKPAEPCVQIPWPEEGLSFSYNVTRANGSPLYDVNLSFGGIEDVARGDGHKVPALVIEGDGAKSFLAIGSRNLIGTEYEFGRTLDLNKEWAYFGIPLMGRCMGAGHQVALSHESPIHQATVRVLEGSDASLRMVMEVPGLRSIWDSGGDATRYEMTWSGLAPVASVVHVLGERNGTWEPVTSARLAQVTGSVGLPPEVGEAPSYGFAAPASDSPCWALPGRHPDFHDLPARVPFREYIAGLEANEELQRYLGDNPDACAAVVNYEIVDEPESTAFVWTSLFVSPAGRGYVERMVTRCFDAPALVTLFGDCQVSRQYHDSDALGPQSGPAYKTDQIKAGVNIKEGLENVGRIAKEDFTRFTWRAQPPGDDVRALEISVGQPGTGGAFVFDFGQLYKNVSYENVGGPAPGAGSWQSDYVRVHEDGWVSSAALHWFS